MSGGAPLGEVDGDSVTIIDGDETHTLQLTSPVRGMHVLEDVQSDRDSGIVNAGPEAETATSTTSKTGYEFQCDWFWREGMCIYGRV